MLDSTVVALALPSIRADLETSRATLQWILNGYLLAIAALVVTAGRLGDIYGRRRVFCFGLATFAVGSVLAGAAPSATAVIAGRFVQGAGAAAMLPLSLALVTEAFPPAGRARAVGIWAGVSSIALALGPLAGGALVDADWRLIFWINVPFCLAGLAVTLAAARESRDESAQRLDVPGLALLGAALVAIVLPLAEAEEWGFGSARTIGVLAVGLALAALFHRVERRSDHPLVDFTLFRNRPYLGATAAAFALVGAYWEMMLLQPQFLQDVLGHSAVVSGFLILPITIPMVILSPLAGPLIARFGARLLMTVGMVCGAVGLALLAQLDGTADYADLLPGYLLFGVALGLVYAPMSSAAMAALPQEKAGIASGVLSMNRVMAGALTVAIGGAIFQSVEAASTQSGSVAFTDGLSAAMWFAAALVLVGAFFTWRLVRSAPASGRSPEAPPVDAVEHHHHRRFHL
jgi:EmrB/QacA subfamily drug resistance transporter